MARHTVSRRQVRKLRHRVEVALQGRDRRELAAEKRYQRRHAHRRVAEF